jgi:glycine dehydrogenase subunit 2
MTQPRVRPYHAPVWSEPLIHELGRSGERGVILPAVEEEIKKAVGKPEAHVPKKMRRREKPDIPELSQPQALRHWLHLSQMTLGMEMGIDLGVGTCTMKYSPKVNEELAAMIAGVHPDQPEETIQGLLEVAWRFANVYLHEISGMDAFTFQPPGGSAGAFNNAAMIRKYHQLNSELEQRDEIITTIFSHPCDAACPATAGFKVITLYPDEETGHPSVEALKAAVSKRTAGIFVTNPEDTGIFNEHIEEWTKIVHEVGGICAYDQANLNSVMGVTRARDAGFDMSFFNLHKTFSSPHGSSGPGSGAVGVTKELEELLPIPIIVKTGEKYHLDYDRPKSIGRVRDFLGNLQVVVRAYAWAAALGADGLREAAEVSMINNQYLTEKMKLVPGVTKPYGGKRLDQVRWSLEKLKKDTGCGINEVNRRVIDYGIQSYFTSHHPWIVPEPFTPEPCETYSKADIDYWVAVLRRVCEEAYEDPEILRKAPHNSSMHVANAAPFDDPDKWGMSWRAYRRKMK